MQIQSLKLYHFPGSRSARARWALHETHGDDFAVAPMKLLEGAQYAPEFLALNPNHAVPVLEITWADGEVQHLLESVAIVAWLADAFTASRLAPEAALTRDRADYLQMLQFGGATMDALLWQIRLHRDLLPEADADQRSIERATGKFAQEVEPQLVARLERSAYICGDVFTAADIVIGHNVFWARAYGLCRDAALRAYLSRLSARAAFRKAFDDLPRGTSGE